MSNKNFSTTSEVITPAIAEAYLMRNIENRPLNKARILYYADQMKKGLWQLNGEPICFDINGKLVNGQHRLEAVKLAGVDIETVVCRNVPEKSFMTYDSGMNRKTSDIFALCDILNATNISSCVRKFHMLSVGQMGRALSKGGKDIAEMRISNTELVALYNKHPEAFQMFNNYAACLSRSLRIFSQSEIAGTMSYLHICKGHSEEKIFTFFDILFGYKRHPEFNNGEEMKATHDLRQRIANAKLRGLSLTGRMKSQLLAKAWNLYIAGKDVRVLKITENEDVQFV